MRLATPEEIAKWDQLVAANPDGGNVLQCRAFGEVKAKHGWETRHLIIDEIAVLALVRSIPFLGEYWYIPKGPGVKTIDQLVKVLKSLSRTKAFAIKIDPELSRTSNLESKISKLVTSKSKLVKVRDIQYNTATVVVDLTMPEEEILASFKQKTRYNVRLAVKKGVTVEPVEASHENIDAMYKLARETYTRAGVYVRDKKYFADFWKLHAKRGTGQMFFSKYEGKVLGAAFITYLGEDALYKDGASSREHSEVQVMYALQWGIMRWLKSRGIKRYDLHGVPPVDQIDNPKHPLAGLARFKTGFSTEVVEYMGTYDLPIHRASYAVWRAFGERLALAYESRFKKRLFY